MRKSYFIFVIFAFVFMGCNSDNEETPIQPKENEIEGDWALTTRIIYYEGETFVEDLINEECESYNTYSFQGEDELELHTFNSTNNCEQIIIPQKWSFESENQTLTVIDVSTNYTVVYKIDEMTNKKLTLEIISQGGDKLEGTGFEVYLIFVK